MRALPTWLVSGQLIRTRLTLQSGQPVLIRIAIALNTRVVRTVEVSPWQTWYTHGSVQRLVSVPTLDGNLVAELSRIELELWEHGLAIQYHVFMHPGIFLLITPSVQHSFCFLRTWKRQRKDLKMQRPV